MVVDDEEAFRYVVRHIAQDTGHQVIEVADCEQALARIREQPPDVVVVDMDAAPAGGAALLEQIGGGGARAVPVIVCTTRPPGLEQKRALAAAYAIVPKHDISRSAFAALLDGALHQTREVP
jgi:CheY-like chemotaxis protein